VNPLDVKCPLCRAEPGAECVNTLNRAELLPGRIFHMARTCPSRWEERGAAECPCIESGAPVEWCWIGAAPHCRYLMPNRKDTHR
jgi:hypothetical protein